MSQPSQIELEILTDHYTRTWFRYIDQPLQDLVRTAYGLYQDAKEHRGDRTGPPVNDFAYITFPMAVAYEGFVKQYLNDLGLLSDKWYFGRRFRVGRSINPDVKPDHRDEMWLFDDLKKQCGSGVARQMWQTWLECRNHVFHFFPGKYQPLTLARAGNHLWIMTNTMEQAVACQPVDRLGLDSSSATTNEENNKEKNKK